MQILSVANGKLCLRSIRADAVPSNSNFATGLKALDDLLPPDRLGRGAVHEVLGQKNNLPWGFALLLVHSAIKSLKSAAVVWSDPRRELNPPALSTALPMSQLYLLQSKNAKDELWALSQCLQCRGVGAVVASPRRISRIEARKLQLSAERDGGIGVLVRPTADTSAPYAAATRWLVKPAKGDEFVQRFDVQLIHGHGGQVGKNIVLEVNRDTFDPNLVRAIDPMAHRQDQAKIARASA